MDGHYKYILRSPSFPFPSLGRSLNLQYILHSMHYLYCTFINQSQFAEAQCARVDRITVLLYYGGSTTVLLQSCTTYCYYYFV